MSVKKRAADFKAGQFTDPPRFVLCPNSGLRHETWPLWVRFARKGFTVFCAGCFRGFLIQWEERDGHTLHQMVRAGYQAAPDVQRALVHVRQGRVKA